VLAQVHSSQLSEKDKTRILGANAQRLLYKNTGNKSVTCK
jgi:hypothetical protein